MPAARPIPDAVRRARYRAAIPIAGLGVTIAAMSRGAFWAGTPLQSEAEGGEPPRDSDGHVNISDFGDGTATPPAAPIGERAMLGLLGLIAFAWIAAMAGLAMTAIGTRPIDLATVLRGLS